MPAFWGLFVITGLGAVMAAQIMASVACFGLSPMKGLASLIVPGYLFVGVRHTPYYLRVIGLWGCGVAAIVAGTIALS
jgi:hypothetical protein